MIAKVLTMPRFDTTAQEVDFWANHDARKFLLRRISMGVSLVLFSLFGILDGLIGQEQTEVLLAIRAVTISVMIASYIYFCGDRTPQQREYAIIVFSGIAIASIIMMTLVAPGAAAGYYHFGLALMISFSAVMVVPRFKVFSWIIFTSMAGYLATLPLSPIPPVQLGINVVFVLLIAAAVIVSMSEREQLDRRQAKTSLSLAAANTELMRTHAEALQARDAALAANIAKNRFVASVSHELRTPMNAIIGFSDVIRTELFGKVEPEVYQEYIGYVHSSGLLLQANIDDLLDLSRIEEGKLGWAEEQFSLRMVLRNVIATCQSKADTSEVHISLDDDPQRIHLRADPARISQALINLITNAIKFTDAGGKVTVASRIGSEGDLTISITDTGRGMSPEVLARVREPYVQGHDDSASRSKGGLGLGLAIVSGILDKVGGRLDLQSEEAVGTVATLVIPATHVTICDVQAA